MENLNAKKVKKALEIHTGILDKACEECPYNREAYDEICLDVLVVDTLALISSQEQRIKELTEENEAWQKALITEKENADKAYYELACEVENLRDENERLRAELEKRPPKLIITKLQKETELNATEDKL